MNASEVMTRDVISVRPDMPTREIAQLLLDNCISAVPVVDDTRAPIGMVSEGDLIGREEPHREARRDWWLALLAEGEPLNAGFLVSIRPSQLLARDVMSSPVVTIGENTDAREVARLLKTYRIKRMPVVRDGRMIGIVSRADLLHCVAGRADSAAPRKTGLLAEALAGLDQHFSRRRPADRPNTPAASLAPDDAALEASDFRRLTTGFALKEIQRRENARHAAEQQHRARVAQLIDDHISDERWRTMIHRARLAAENGEKDFMLLRFPAQLCADSGRAINVMEPGWQATLRGDAAEIYLRWEHDLKARGFHLSARVLEFPDGVPGDIGLFLTWV